MRRDRWPAWDGDTDWDDDPSSAAPPDAFVASTYVPDVWPDEYEEDEALPPRQTRRLPTYAPPAAGVRTTAPTPTVGRGRITGRIPSVPTATGKRPAWTDVPTAHIPGRLPTLPPVDVPHSAPPARSSRDGALRAFCEAPTGKRPALPGGGLTVISGNPQPPFRPRPHRRSFAGLAALALVGVILVAVTIHSASTFSGTPSYAGLAADVSRPAGSSSTPLAQAQAWQSQSGVFPILGGGGAAAPGMNAPGTAKAPASPPPPTAQAPHIASQPAATTPPKPTAAPAKPAAAPAKPAAAPPVSGILPAPVTPWPPANAWMSVPGHIPYAVSDPPGDPFAGAFGQCTWWAQHERPDENLRGIGNAMYWASGAMARGYRVGTTPAVNATVVFQPGVQGAGGPGHVAHVMALYPDGWFLISEMNAFGNGGGWGRVSFRYAHAGPGVQFIY